MPTAREVEPLPPTRTNTPPETVAPEMFTAPVPVLVMVTFWVALVPTATLPNETLLDDAERTPPPELPTLLPLPFDAFVVYPAQPERPMQITTNTKARNRIANEVDALCSNIPRMSVDFCVRMFANTVGNCNAALYWTRDGRKGEKMTCSGVS